MEDPSKLEELSQVDPASPAGTIDTLSILDQCAVRLVTQLQQFPTLTLGGAAVADLCVLLRRATAECTGSACPADLLVAVTSLLHLHLALADPDVKVRACTGREWPLDLPLPLLPALAVVPRPQRRQVSPYVNEPLLEWHTVLVSESCPEESSPATVCVGDAASSASAGEEPEEAASADTTPSCRTRTRLKSPVSGACIGRRRSCDTSPSAGAASGLRPTRAVSVAPGGALWCSYGPVYWRLQLEEISRLAQQLITQKGRHVTREMLCGQLMIFQNGSVTDLPAYLRCVSLSARSAAAGSSAVPVWLCDAGRCVSAPRSRLLAVPCHSLQLYRRPPQLLLLSGAPLPSSLPAELVRHSLALLAALSLPAEAAAAAELARAAAEAVFWPYTAPHALALLRQMALSSHLKPVLNSVDVVEPLLDVLALQAAAPAPDGGTLSHLVSLLQAAVGVARDDPVRRLLVGCDAVYAVLELGLDDRLRRETEALVRRLLADPGGPVTPAASRQPQRRQQRDRGGATVARRPAAAGAAKTAAARAAEPNGCCEHCSYCRSGGGSAPSWPAGSRHARSVELDGRLGYDSPEDEPDARNGPGRVISLRDADFSTSEDEASEGEEVCRAAGPGRVGQSAVEGCEKLDQDRTADIRKKSSGAVPPDKELVQEWDQEAGTAPAGTASTGEEVSSAGKASDSAPCAGLLFRRGQLARLDSQGELQLESQVLRPQDITRGRLAQVVCALMNSPHGGSVYYGIDSGRRAVGLPADRETRDRLRVGIDHLVTDRLLPPVPPGCCQLVFVPVLERGQRPEQYRPALHSQHVLQLRCRPTPCSTFVARELGESYEFRTLADGRRVVCAMSMDRLRSVAAAREAALVSCRQEALRAAVRMLGGGDTCARCHRRRPPPDMGDGEWWAGSDDSAMGESSDVGAH